MYLRQKKNQQENKMGLILAIAEIAYVYGVACGQVLGEAGFIRMISQII